MYHKKIYIYKYENTTAGHVYRKKKKQKKKQFWRKGDRVSPTSAMKLHACGVLRPASLYKYEKKIKL